MWSLRCGLYGAFGLDGYALVEGKGDFEPFQGFSGIDFDHILRYIGADCGVGEFGEGNERDLIAFEDEVRRLDDAILRKLRLRGGFGRAAGAFDADARRSSEL